MSKFMTKMFPKTADFIEGKHYLIEPISMIAKMTQNNFKPNWKDPKYEVDVEIKNFSINILKDQFDNLI